MLPWTKFEVIPPQDVGGVVNPAPSRQISPVGLVSILLSKAMTLILNFLEGVTVLELY